MTQATNATRDEAARALGAIAGGQSIDWEHVLHRRSFIELDALARAEALLDDGAIRVLCGPFERLESPWLQPQFGRLMPLIYRCGFPPYDCCHLSKEH
jgi:malonate decarboxylase beta subunit